MQRKLRYNLKNTMVAKKKTEINSNIAAGLGSAIGAAVGDGVVNAAMSSKASAAEDSVVPEKEVKVVYVHSEHGHDDHNVTASTTPHSQAIPNAQPDNNVEVQPLHEPDVQPLHEPEEQIAQETETTNTPQPTNDAEAVAATPQAPTSDNNGIEVLGYETMTAGNGTSVDVAAVNVQGETVLLADANQDANLNGDVSDINIAQGGDDDYVNDADVQDYLA